MKGLYDLLKEVCIEHNLVIVDVNEYHQPLFKDKFEKLIKGRKVAVSFVSNKMNTVNNRKEEISKLNTLNN